MCEMKFNFPGFSPNRLRSFSYLLRARSIHRLSHGTWHRMRAFNLSSFSVASICSSAFPCFCCFSISLSLFAKFMGKLLIRKINGRKLIGISFVRNKEKLAIRVIRFMVHGTWREPSKSATSARTGCIRCAQCACPISNGQLNGGIYLLFFIVFEGRRGCVWNLIDPHPPIRDSSSMNCVYELWTHLEE